MEKVT